MALPADGQDANGLTKVTEIPAGKQLVFIDPTTNEGGIITLEDLTKQILNGLASQTFALDAGQQTILQALNTLNSESLPNTLVPTNTLLTDALKIDKSSICFFSLAGSIYTGNDVPETNYQWGTAIAIKRMSTSCTIILFPETSGDPMVNYWLSSSDAWTGWKKFVS